MGLILSYSIISSVILIALYLTYKITLSREKLFSFNRGVIYLTYFLTLTLSFAYMKGLLDISHSAASGGNGMSPQIFIDPDFMQTGLADGADANFLIFSILLTIYLVGMIAAAVRFIYSMLRIRSIIKQSDRCELGGGYILSVTGRHNIAPFSWWNYIVVSKAESDSNLEAIITHEEAHLRYRHWIDQVIANIIAIMQWYNPASWLMIEELKTIHEYQADDAVINSGADIKQYQYLLIEKAVGKRFPSPANSLNHSKLKNRVTMMYKSNSKAGRRWAVLAAVPATVAAIAVLNVPAFAEVLSETEQASISFSSVDKVTNINLESQIPLLEAIAENADNVSEFAEISSNDLAQETTVASEDKKSADTKDKKVDKADASKLEVYVNGEKVTSEQMHSIDPSDIQSIDIKKNNEGNPNTINITLKEGKTLKSAATSKSVKENNSKDVYVAVEEPAEYPGGQQELMKYLMENVKYPEEAVKNNVQGNVIVKFVVSKTGKIRDAQVLKSVDPELDKEAIRIIESMPAWIPAKNNGEAVDSYFNLPVRFKLRSDAETSNNQGKQEQK